MVEQILQQFNEINEMFWNGSPFQWVFYASIILILIFEKNRIKKLILGVFPLVILVVMYNPAMPSILHRFFYSDAYYVRLYSVVPIFYCLAHGVILVLNKTNGLVKCLSVCAVSVFVILAGHSIFQEGWLQKANNLEKVPQELAEVIDVIPQGEEPVTVAFPNPLNVYARQVDARIKMPYGRFVGYPIEMLDELNKDVPDVSNLMLMAGRQGVDYVVVRKNDESAAAFTEGGYALTGETQRWAVYPVTGVPHIAREYNDKNQIVSVTTCDAEGNAVSNSQGYATVLYEYDRWGNRIKDTYIDRHGAEFLLDDGYSCVQRKCSYSGVVTSITYLNTNDQPVMVDGRYETRYSYNSDRRIAQESYFDEQGQPVNRIDTFYAVKEIEYNREGQITEEKYKDTQGQPVLSSEGYSGFIKEYDENNRLVEELFYGEDGNPAIMEDGCAGYQREYDTPGNVIRETYIDEYGNPIARNEKYAVIERRYDEMQNLIEESYWDSEGNPYELDEGYCAFHRICDELGNIVEEGFENLDGTETTVTNQNNESFWKNLTLSNGVEADSLKEQYSFNTSLEDNRFSSVQWQLYDGLTDEFITNIWSADEVGFYSDSYVHEEKTGWYKIRLKGNTNLRDEFIYFFAFLQNGKEYQYSVNVISIEDKQIQLLDIDFTGPCPILEQELFEEEEDR